MVFDAPTTQIKEPVVHVQAYKEDPAYQQDLVSQIKIGGMYRYYQAKAGRGDLYRVIAVVRDVHTLEWMVIYETLYQNQLCQNWSRKLESFVELIDVEGNNVRRFTLID